MFRNDRLLMPGHDLNRVEAFDWLATTLLGDGSTLQQLLKWIERNISFPDNAYIDEVDLPWLQRISTCKKWSIPSQFSIHPVNSLALLGHWRVLAQLIANLPPEQQVSFPG